MAIQPHQADQPASAAGGANSASGSPTSANGAGPGVSLTLVGAVIGAAVVIATVVLFAVALAPRKVRERFMPSAASGAGSGGGRSLDRDLHCPPSQRRLVGTRTNLFLDFQPVPWIES